MRKKTKKQIFFWIRILIAVGAIVYIIFKFDLSQMWEELTLALRNPTYVILAVMAFLGFLAFHSFRWYILYRPRKNPYTYPYLYRSVLIHTLFNYVLPTTIGGDVYRVLDTGERQGKEVAFSVVWMDRLCGFIGIFTFAFLASIIYAAVSGNLLMMGIFGAGFVIAGGVIIAFLSKTINSWLAPRLARFKIFNYPVGRKIADAFTHVTAYRDHKLNLLLAVLVSLGLQTVLVCVWYFLYLSLPEGGRASFVHFMVTIPLVNTAAIFSIGGWGVREVAFVNILGAFSLSVDSSTALANTILFDAVNVFIGLVGGLFLIFRKDTRGTAPIRREE